MDLTRELLRDKKKQELHCEGNSLQFVLINNGEPEGCLGPFGSSSVLQSIVVLRVEAVGLDGGSSVRGRLRLTAHPIDTLEARAAGAHAEVSLLEHHLDVVGVVQGAGGGLGGVAERPDIPERQAGRDAVPHETHEAAGFGAAMEVVGTVP